MAIVLGQGAFSGGSDMGKDQPGGGFGGNPFKIDTVPCRKRGGEDAWIRAQFWLGVPAYAKSISIDGSTTVKTETAVVGLSEDAMGWFRD